MSVGEYAIGIVGVSVAVSLIELLMSDDSGGVKKTLSFLLSVATVCAVMLPLGGLLNDFLDGISSGRYEVQMPESEQGDFSELVGEAEKLSGEELGRALGKSLEKEFSLPEGSVEVVAVLEFGDSVSIKSITVYLSGRAMWQDPRKIKEHVRKLTGVECEVVTG